MIRIAIAILVLAVVSVSRAAPPEGPFEENWESIQTHYKTPQWFKDGKFGIMMHWGLYAVPAYGSEWYVRYMYGGNAGVMNWHVQKFGPLDRFGYKEFIPQFTAAKWDPDAWAELFRKSGAKYVVPTAEHHDGYSLWDSDLNRFNSMKMGPKRDLIGDLGKAVRAKGLRYGVSNHSIEHFTFIRPPAADIKTDLSDPQWAEFYSVADRSDEAKAKFEELWVRKNMELIDKYQPDMLWFDNGLNGRSFDRIKLQVAAWYYNRATEWGKDVSLSTKSTAYLQGSIRDYERQGRILPRGIKTFDWQVDDPIGEKFGYNTNIRNYKDAGKLIRRLVDTVAMGGN